MFKSGVPIGKVSLTNNLNNNKVIVEFYRDFSQLKYVKISSHTKENINIDQSNKKNFRKNSDQMIKLNEQVTSINVLKKQKVINEEIRVKLELENKRLKNNLITTKKKLIEKNKQIKKDNLKTKNIEFLELNLLHGHKCRKSFFKSSLYKVGTDEYRACVLNEGSINKN